jgi:hypothetical protein
VRSDGIFDLLSLASELVERIDPLFEPPSAEASGLLPMLLETDSPETTAVLTLMADLLDDRDRVAEVRRTLRERNHPVPPHVTGFSPIEITGVACMTDHVYRDGDDILVGFRTAAGEELILFVLVDHNLGSVVKDVSLGPGPLDTRLPRLQERAAEADPDLVWVDLHPADARARLESAVEMSLNLEHAIETGTWPGLRPLLEFVRRHLPEGGEDYEWAEVDDAEASAILERFLTSEWGEPLDAAQRQAVRAIIAYGAGYNPAGPLGWGPVQAEMFLAFTAPHAIVLSAEAMESLPDLLRRFVRFAHAERGLREENTRETLASIERFTPAYHEELELVRRDPVYMASLRLMEAPDRDAYAREIVSNTVGAEAVDTFDAEPLPDEPFRWEGIPEAARPRVQDILALADRCCEVLFEIEYRTAVRRMLARIATRDHSVLLRGEVDTAAAALCWIVAHANHSIGPYDRVRTMDLTAWFDREGWSPSQRAYTLLEAAGIDVAMFKQWKTVQTPDLLVARVRQWLLDFLAGESPD